MNRILLGALGANLVLFFWGFATHVLLPTGQMGYSQLADPQQDAVLAAIGENIEEQGLYYLPWIDQGAEEAELEAATARFTEGPTAFLVALPDGGEAMSGRQLGLQFLTELLFCLCVALVIARIPGLGARVAVGGLFGLACFASISLPQWNWYGFPPAYVFAEGFDSIGGGLLAGLVLARLIPAPSAG